MAPHRVGIADSVMVRETGGSKWMENRMEVEKVERVWGVKAREAEASILREEVLLPLSGQRSPGVQHIST